MDCGSYRPLTHRRQNAAPLLRQGQERLGAACGEGFRGRRKARHRPEGGDERRQ